MISLHNISKQYGARCLFKNLYFDIKDKDRIALVGSNGAGKTTLMKIIIGEIESDSGKVICPRFDTEGYLPQDDVLHKGRTLYEEAETAFGDLTYLRGRIEEISHEISTSTASGDSESSRVKELVKELNGVQQMLEYREGYTLETKIKQILTGLGFKEKDLYRMTEEFSGGWQMRIGLAKLLLKEPTVLLLDEPTNHLDIESLEWLESYLKQYQGSIVVVSHDSRFLDNLVNRVIEVSAEKATEYSGNFSSYIKQKAQALKTLQSAYDNQRRMIERANRFIERFRYKSTKARQVQNHVKMLEKIELVEIEKDEKTIHFDFPQPVRSGKIVIELDNVTKSYESNPVFDGLTFEIERGDRIALLGINGSGKSTLARIIAGIEPFQEGKRKEGHNVLIAYYAQNVAEALDPDKTVLDTVREIAISKQEKEIRAFLGCFLFTGDEVFKPVSVLSGGEKSRLALARMLFAPANLLIFDEPTNHLDVKSKDVLQQSLLNFSGTCVIVSHDRDFLLPLINKVIALKEDGFDLYHGNVDDYLLEHQAASVSKEKQETRSHLNVEVTRKREEAEKRQERYRKLKPLKDALVEIEQEIAAMEKKKNGIEAAFSSQETYEDENLIKSLNMEHSEISSLLDSLYEKWANIENKIDEIAKED